MMHPRLRRSFLLAIVPLLIGTAMTLLCALSAVCWQLDHHRLPWLSSLAICAAGVIFGRLLVRLCRKYKRCERILVGGLTESLTMSLVHSGKYWVAFLGSPDNRYYFVDTADNSTARALGTDRTYSVRVSFSFDPNDAVIVDTEKGIITLTQKNIHASTMAADKLLDMLQARYALDSGEYAAALHDVLLNDPNFHEARVLLAHHYLARGNNEAALTELSRVVDHGSVRDHRPEVYFTRALAHFRLGRFAEALRDVEITLRQEPDNSAALEFRSEIRRVHEDRQHMRDGDFAELLEKYKMLESKE